MRLKKENNCIPDETFQQLIDGELKLKEAEHVEKHISECEFCWFKYLEMKNFIEQFAKEIPSIGDNEIIIPEFKPYNSQKIDFQKNRKIYWWSVAAVFLLLLSVFVFNDFGKRNIEMEYVYQEMNSEIDANVPWHDQTSTIYILDESGEIIDQIKNL